jgi:hypothetical protein
MCLTDKEKIMNFLTKVMQLFNGKTEQKKVLLKNDIKFSALIQNIHKNVIEANESLEFVGKKYLEEFFHIEPEINKIDDIHQKLVVLEKQLNTGDTQAANQLIDDLKEDVTRLSNPIEGEVIQYRPKMTSFEVPVFKEGVWRTEALTIPKLSLSPMEIPKIKELTFTSKVQNVEHEGDDVYVRFMHNEPVSRWRKSNTLINENMTEIKIAIQPENHSDDINEVISHYEQILRSH